MNYLISHYKGTYRIKVPYDLSTNSFARTLDGKLEDIDAYIDCYYNVKITYGGKRILKVYIPSTIRGNNILKAINEIDENVITKVIKTDAEIVIYFHVKYFEKIVHLLKPKTSGAGISPFSSKNLPRNKAYKIPDEELSLYKDIIKNIPQKDKISIAHITKNFIKSLATRKNTLENIKGDMALKCLYNKEYIHNIGKWNEYISFLKKNLQEIQ